MQFGEAYGIRVTTDTGLMILQGRRALAHARHSGGEETMCLGRGDISSVDGLG